MAHFYYYNDEVQKLGNALVSSVFNHNENYNKRIAVIENGIVRLPASNSFCAFAVKALISKR